MYAPVALFVYNRLNHIQEVINSLIDNIYSDLTELYVFSDGPKDSTDIQIIDEIREYVKSINGFKSVTLITREINIGLTESVVLGIDKVFENHEKIIVLEDDILTSKDFLLYMNNALETYAENLNVGSISGYRYPPMIQSKMNFFLRGGDCWGWATWKNRWSDFSLDIDYRNSFSGIFEKARFNYLFTYNFTDLLKKSYTNKKTWAIRWHCHLYFNNKLTLYPNITLVNNIGNDGSGTNCTINNYFNSSFNENPTHDKLSIKNSWIGFFDFSLFFVYLRVKNQLNKIKNKWKL